MGMKLFSIILRRYQNFKSNFMGYKSILLEKIFDEVIDQRLKEMMNHLNCMMHKDLWMGY